jgi:predicted DNA-binding protein
MWPFTRKRRQRSAPVSQQPPVVGIIADRGLHDLSKNDAELRVWLPEEGRAALDAIADRLDVVRAKYLREFLVTYLYGLHELLKMQTEQTGLYYVPPPSNEPPLPLYSRARTEECIPGLGKNIVPLKLYLPQRMKEDLQTLGDRAGVPLSQFAREALVSHFFGQTLWLDRLWKLSPEQERVVSEWEQGIREPDFFCPDSQSCPEGAARIIEAELRY